MFRKSGLIIYPSLIISLCLTSLILSERSVAQKLNTTNRISVIGGGIGAYVTPDTTIKTISYFLDGMPLLTESPQKTVTVMMMENDGFQKLYAKVTYNNLSVRFTDTVAIFVAKKDELSRLVLETITYKYKSQTFPDSLIQLPEHTLILGYTHYTTFKTLIKYLNPTF